MLTETSQRDAIAKVVVRHFGACEIAPQGQLLHLHTSQLNISLTILDNEHPMYLSMKEEQ